MDLILVLKKILFLVNLNLICKRVHGNISSQTSCAGKLLLLPFTFADFYVCEIVNDKEISKHYTWRKMQI